MPAVLPPLEARFVDGDLHEPRAELGLATKSRQGREPLKNSFLSRFLGIGRIVQNGHGRREKSPLVGTNQVVKQLSVAFAHAPDQLGFPLLHAWLDGTHGHLPHLNPQRTEKPGLEVGFPPNFRGKTSAWSTPTAGHPSAGTSCLT